MANLKAGSSLSLIGQISAIAGEINEAEEALTRLNAHVKRLEVLQAKVAEAIAERSNAVAALLGKADAGASVTAALTRLRAVEKSTSTALLKLQSQMQHENRAFTSVSNVLKTRHDTVKNTIGNIR